ncbi:MAG: hypothetical protein WD872_07955 [Pirellulaceae bacterium]
MRTTRYFIAAALLAGGLCAAWPFRLARPTVALPAPDSLVADVTLRRQDVVLSVVASQGVSPAVGLENEPSAAWPGVPDSTSKREWEALGPPPALPRWFDPSASASAPRGESRTAWQPSPVAPLPQRSAPRQHRLRDGDTLEKLAERYLGDAARAAEIFEANRDVLATADLLPLGRILLLPPRDLSDNLEPVHPATTLLLAPTGS